MTATVSYVTYPPAASAGRASHRDYTDRVVVGLDGSPASMAALDWAARWIEHLGGQLTMLLAYGPSSVVRGEPLADHLIELARETAEGQANHARSWLADHHPDVRAEVRILAAGAAPALLEATRTADVVVIGTRGLSGMSALLRGSIANSVIAGAHGPVIAVSEGAVPSCSGPVVIGLDGSPEAARAAEYGFEHAETSGAEVIAVSTWQNDYGYHSLRFGVLPVDNDHFQSRREEHLRTWLAPLRLRHPSVPVRSVVRGEDPVAALVEASRGAALVVVGSRGLGPVGRTLFGSVSQAVVRGAKAPTVVVP